MGQRGKKIPRTPAGREQLQSSRKQDWEQPKGILKSGISISFSAKMWWAVSSLVLRFPYPGRHRDSEILSIIFVLLQTINKQTNQPPSPSGCNFSLANGTRQDISVILPSQGTRKEFQLPQTCTRRFTNRPPSPFSAKTADCKWVREEHMGWPTSDVSNTT